MAAKSSFDVSTGVDLQEVDNALNQARKEIGQRFDFKGSHCVINLDRDKGVVMLEADDPFRMNQLWDVVLQRMAKRKVPIKNLNIGEDQVSLGKTRREIGLKQGIDQDTAKKITKAFKAEKFKKAQISIQGDTLRVSSPSKDELQEVMSFLTSKDFGLELQFGNRR